jgi:hypothetical protein
VVSYSDIYKITVISFLVLPTTLERAKMIVTKLNLGDLFKRAREHCKRVGDEEESSFIVKVVTNTISLIFMVVPPTRIFESLKSCFCKVAPN